MFAARSLNIRRSVGICFRAYSSTIDLHGSDCALYKIYREDGGNRNLMSCSERVFFSGSQAMLCVAS